MLRNDLVYKEECYKIIGILYRVYKDLGGDLLEKHYQKAVATALQLEGINFNEQYPIKLYYEKNYIGIYYIDFLLQIGDARIVLEIKKNKNFGLKNIKQVNNYIKTLGVKLGILANFTSSGVIYKRIVNLSV